MNVWTIIGIIIHSQIVDNVVINVPIVLQEKMIVLDAKEIIDLQLYQPVHVIQDTMIQEFQTVLNVTINVLPVKLLLVTA